MMIRFLKIPAKLDSVVWSLATSALIVLAISPSARAQRCPFPQPVAPPVLIKKIVINGELKTEANSNQIKITRANGDRVDLLQTGFPLYCGDVIQTSLETEATLAFLDPPFPERDNEVVVKADARVGISSTDSWWGTVWAKVKGTFTSKTTYAQMGAKGTEYQVTAFKNEDRATLIVIEGEVEVTKGTFEMAGELTVPPDPFDWQIRVPRFVSASFAPPPPPQQQFIRPVDAVAGQVTTLGLRYNVHSDCHQPHKYEFRTSDSTPWFQLIGEKHFDVGPLQTVQLERDIQIDATKLTAGVYDAKVLAVCLDCQTESRCSQSQLEWGYKITVSGPGLVSSPSPLPSPSPSAQQPFTVYPREVSPVTKSSDQKGPAKVPDVLALLNWTNRVLLVTQPTYSAQNLIPHFSTVEQRSQSFRDARERAALRDDPASQKILGDVYCDWGQGVWAGHAYDQASTQAGGQQTPSQAGPWVDRAEAYRLTGRLEDARLLTLSNTGPQSPAAFNLIGNIAFDNARIALDKGNRTQAEDYLKEAERSYSTAVSAIGAQGISNARNTTPQTNLAEVHVVVGNLALLNGAASTARNEFTAATQSLQSIQQPNSIYPFAVTDLGRAYQGLGNAASQDGKTVEANSAYAQAESQHRQAIAAHPDFAEAYFNLGDLKEDVHDKEGAKENYWRAIRARPEQPAAYYPLALLLQHENPQLARSLAATFLQLERDVFKQGEKAKNAEKITRGENVQPPPRPFGSNSKPPDGPVPNVLNMTVAQAGNAIERAGLIRGRTDERSDQKPAGTVIAQTPSGDSRALPRSAVDIVVSTGPGTDVAVPDVLNKPQAEAKAKIESAGLRVGNVAKRNDPSRAEGTVLEQKPAGGTNVSRGSPIEIVVASAEPPVVPNVVGLSQTEATTAIENAGLRVRKIQTRAENKPKNTVVKQSPDAGKTVKRDSNVDLVVSEGVDVPGVINNSRDKATREIIKRGLTVGKIEERGSCKLGDVIEQNPAPHGRVDPGAAVDLVIGALGENPVSVPNLIGRSRDEAVAAIRDKELTLGSVRTEETNQAPEGTVVRQSPKPETQFARNCAFKIDLIVAIPLTVGDYRGLSERTARFQISLIGLSASVEYRETSDQRDGIVLEQDPQPGTRADRGTVVRLVVSRVPAVPVPNVVKMFLPNAKATLENAQLRLGRVTYEKPSTAAVGGTFGFPQSQACRVTRQDPVEGRQVPRGTPVNLWVIEWLGNNGQHLDCRNYINDGN